MEFTLVTPTQQAASLTNVQYVQLPGTEGDLGVLKGHMPLLAALRDNATLTVTHENGEKESFTISGGFADIKPTGVTVLAESIS